MLKTFTSRCEFDPVTIEARTLKDARRQACGLLSVGGPRGLTFDGSDGSSFRVSLYEGQDWTKDAAGRAISGKRLV